MLFVRVATFHFGSVAGSLVHSTTFDSTGANWIILVVNGVVPGTLTVADNLGNPAYTQLTAQAGSTLDTRLFYILNPIVGAGHIVTVTASQSPSFVSLNGVAYSGQATFESENGSHTNSAATIQPRAVTPLEDNCAIIQGLSWYFGGTGSAPSINQSFSIADQTVPTGTKVGGAIADLFQGSLAAVNPTWTMSASSFAGAVAAVFAPVVVPPPVYTVSDILVYGLVVLTRYTIYILPARLVTIYSDVDLEVSNTTSFAVSSTILANTSTPCAAAYIRSSTADANVMIDTK